MTTIQWMKPGTYVLGAVFIALLVYTGGIGIFYLHSKTPKKEQVKIVSTQAPQEAQVQVLAATEKKDEQIGPQPLVLPEKYSMVVIPRKQMYALSCEFAAATTILYHYTGDIAFAKENAKTAEKLLIKEVGVSQNPNVGIRMGPEKPGSDEELYVNLNHSFGGSDYYGVHAPPFIDVFAKYQLKAKPILKSENIIRDIQQALYSGHLVMTWLRIGYGGKADLVFDYGTVPVIKGEHVVVIHGYDKTGVDIMDPGNGGFSHLKYEDLLGASSFFTLPYLEVYQVEDAASSVEETVSLGSATGLLRENLNVIVENGTKKIGEGTEISEILKEFGYHIVEVRSAVQLDGEGISIQLKKEFKDYAYILKKDLTVSEYSVASISADLSASSSADAIITVGD